MKRFVSTTCLVATLVVTCSALSGCWLAVAGVGAEAGYIASQKDRSMSETIGDQAIVSSVKTKLLADAHVSGLDINVDSFKGIVTLKGVVDSAEEAARAQELAFQVAGVKEVVSRLYVD